MNEDEIDWDELPSHQVKVRWDRLSDQGKRDTWDSATHRERKSIKEVIPEDEMDFLPNRSSHRPNTRKSENQEEEKIQRAKFELTKIHREQVEEEITRIRETLQEAVNTSERRSQRRRTENIYVLVAIGIVTGFFTIYPDFKISTQSVDLLAAGIAGTSVLFLFIKLNTASIGELGQDTIGSKADRVADFLFQVSISGAFLLAIGTIGVNAFDISLTPESSNIFATVGVISTTLVALFDMYSKSYDERETVKFSDVQDAMFDLPNEDSEKQEKNVDEFLDYIKKYKEKSASTKSLTELKDRISIIRGLTDAQIKRIEDQLDDLIEEKSKEAKTKQELREEEKKEREEEREKQRKIVKSQAFGEQED